MASSVTLENYSEQEVEVLVTDHQGHQVNIPLDPQAKSSIAIAPGKVFLKLFRPGSRGGRGFGMSLMNADLTTAIVDSGHKVIIVNGASGPIFQK